MIVKIVSSLQNAEVMQVYDLTSIQSNLAKITYDVLLILCDFKLN